VRYRENSFAERISTGKVYKKSGLFANGPMGNGDSFGIGPMGLIRPIIKRKPPIPRRIVNVAL
jgi:hypothetical protein